MPDISFKKAAVIGAGTMGSGIAAHLANAGLDVVLLDLDADVARGGITRQLKAGGFMRPEFADRVTAGSTKTDMALLADADWIIEAVAERLDIKHALFAAIDKVRKPEAIIASNTSTIPLHALLDGFSPEFAGNFLITHFFNPPRHMRLLELVSGPATRPEVTAAIHRFVDVNLGKGVVVCKDTPGFIGNRIGCYWLAAGLGEGIRLGIDVEVADAAIGKIFGFPKTGIFGLYDLIGNDLMPYLIRSLQDTLGKEDAVQAYAAEPPLLTGMVERGLTGRKGGGGFYRLSADRKTREAIDLINGEYRPQHPVESDSLDAAKGDPRALLDHPGEAGRYAWAVVSRTLAYAASLVPEIADRTDAVDAAMRLGYGWKYGPFELIDRIGAKWFARTLAAEGRDVPPLLAEAAARDGFYRVANGAQEALVQTPSGPAYAVVPVEDGVLSLPALKLRSHPVAGDSAASLWDLGDGVGLLEFHTKMNSFSAALLEAVDKFVGQAPSHFRALVIGNDGPVFSAGADLAAVLSMSERGDTAGIEHFIATGLRAFAAVKYAPLPIVGAGFGAALGGGCEVLLHCHAIAAHAEIGMGLVEPRVGLVPGWAGITELLLRRLERGADAEEAAIATLETVLMAVTSAGAHDARALGLLRPTDGISMNRDRLIADARALALDRVEGFAPPRPAMLTLPAASALHDRLDARSDRLAPHDRVIGQKLVEILSGPGPISEEALTDRATHAFVELAQSQPTRERIAHMLKTGKPLRN